MNEPVAVRSKRLRGFLEEMSWDPKDLAKLVFQRRNELSFFPDKEDESALAAEFEGVLGGRTLLTIDLCAELGVYFDKPPEDFYSSTLNGEAEKLQEAMKAISEAQGGKGKSLRFLRGAALTAAMKAVSKKPSDIAQCKIPRRGKARNEYRNRVYAWSRGTILLPDGEVPFLAETLSVDPQKLIVRAPSQRELEFMRRSSVGRETRDKKRRRKKGGAHEETAVRTLPTASQKVSVELDFEPSVLSEAMADADYRTISIEGPELVIRIPLTPDLIMKGMKPG